ncbi:MAG: dTMP kinase [Syntrophotaleaceae bacterium]
MSLFITFEGIEGCGKTTQISLLCESLRLQGHQVVVTREPGGCAIADAIRQILLDPVHQAMTPKTELLLYAAARAQHVAEVIQPALAQGRIVLCDRYIDATLAYQGYGRGLDRALVEDLNQLATSGCRPDLTLLLDMPAADGLERAIQRNSLQNLATEGRFELEAVAFHDRVRRGYLDLAEKEAQRFRVIEARGSVAEVAERILAVVKTFFASRKQS